MLVIVPKYRAAEYASLAKEFASLRDCRVILDGRRAERRRVKRTRYFDERRRRERRSDDLEVSQDFVLFLC